MRTLRALLLVLVVALAGCEDLITDPGSSGSGSGSGSSATLIVHNLASVPVYFMYISPCSNSSWGSDQLGPAETIPPGGTRRWSVQPGCYDVRAEFSDRSYAQSRLQLDAGVEFTWRLRD